MGLLLNLSKQEIVPKILVTILLLYAKESICSRWGLYNVLRLNVFRKLLSNQNDTTLNNWVMI